MSTLGIVLLATVVYLVLACLTLVWVIALMRAAARADAADAARLDEQT